MISRRWPLLLALLLGCTAQAAPRTEILPLHYRTADELLPTVQTVLGGEGRVSAYGNQLIVNAEPEKIAELQALLPQLDTRPRRLLISVDSQQQRDSRQRGYRVDGGIDAGNVEIVGGRDERHGQDQLRIIRRSSQGSDGSLQQVQATEGYPAQIMVGQSVPVRTLVRDAYGYPREVIEYRDASRGFQVVASVQGEEVQLSIYSQQDRLASPRGAIATQRTDTRVSGRLGEWIDLGGISESGRDSRSTLLSRQAGASSQTQALRLKVELLE
ncbi:secretin N-terminal domain-containing protein [Pseudomonas oryzae]|uniref:Type II and III secretion system protein n=1 Tax=Pseudomonas oryzae TaxID=1392877 RepID=A0A1H1MP30_9PSED|nr:secretin N-terminal domain-containing protein [Pseudomonas oryzae]SDR88506.1 type II and III secretion system protein [Pseudomonas oryzae]